MCKVQEGGPFFFFLDKIYTSLTAFSSDLPQTFVLVFFFFPLHAPFLIS